MQYIWQNGNPNPQAEAMKWGYREIRYHRSERERDFLQARNDISWTHAQPWSVLIAAMGYHWAPGSWEKITDMIQFTQEQGFTVVLQELMDRCFNPYDALGAMRNEAVLRARQGFEFLLYLDNDVLPEKDFLIRLLRWDLPIIAPMVFEPEIGRPLHGPGRQPNTGLQPIRWCVLSMLMFKTAVFNATGPEFWNNAIGADEGYHFQKLWDVGHRPYLDTSLILKVANRPTYPLATNRMEEQEAKSFWDKRKEWLLEPPDRKPLDPSNPRQENEEYMPWLVPSSLPALPMIRGTT